ncbi:ATP-dependent DNA helicase PIF1-like protein [Tanacetum coccineum]
MFTENLELGVTRTIVLMLCRMWDVYAATGRYLSTEFVVCDSKPDGFIRFPFQLVDFDNLEITNNKYLIDAAGYVTNVGRTVQQKTGSKTLDFNLANSRCQSVWVTLWGSLRELLIKKRTNHVDRLYLSSPSSTLILDDEEIPEVKHLKADSSGAEFSKEILPVGCSEAKARTLENLLMWSRNRRHDRIVTAEGMGESGGSSMAGGSRAFETPEFKRLLRHPSVTTPSKVDEVKKQKRGEAEESDVEASFVADTQATSGVGGNRPNTRKNKRRVVDDNATSSWISGMFYTLQAMENFVMRDTIQGQRAKITQRTKVVRRIGKSNVTTSDRGTEVSYHNIGAPSYQCAHCNASMWYEERINKGNRAVNPSFSLCCQEVVYVIKFQKRGLPHALILLWLEDSSKCKMTVQIDNIISAKLPSPTDDPDGYKSVTDYMLHGPCGKDGRYAPCTTEGKCSKHYPKQFYAETVLDEDGYPIYRRRDNKASLKKGKFTFDKGMWCLTTVTYCSNTRPTSMWNGATDQKRLKKVVAVDEINNYLNCRYLAPCEAVWRLFSFDIHYSYSFVMKLNFHLPNQNPVTLWDSEFLPALLEREELLNRNGRSLTDFQDLPRLNPQLLTNIDNRLIREALNFDMNKSRIEHERLHPLLNPEQRLVYEQLIIWDEAPMTQKYAFKALDKTLRDILGFQNPKKREQIFRGMTVLLGGDFRQILLVIPKGKRPDVVQACINRSEFIVPAKAKDGEDEPTWIQIPEQFLIKSSGSPIEKIVAETYPNFIERQHDDEYLKEQAIPTPRNDDVDEINNYMFNKLVGKSVTYNSADEICKASTESLDQQQLYPTEF